MSMMIEAMMKSMGLDREKIEAEAKKAVEIATNAVNKINLKLDLIDKKLDWIISRMELGENVAQPFAKELIALPTDDATEN